MSCGGLNMMGFDQNMFLTLGRDGASFVTFAPCHSGYGRQRKLAPGTKPNAIASATACARLLQPIFLRIF
jgi:hypothetical protein